MHATLIYEHGDMTDHWEKEELRHKYIFEDNINKYNSDCGVVKDCLNKPSIANTKITTKNFNT